DAEPVSNGEALEERRVEVLDWVRLQERPAAIRERARRCRDKLRVRIRGQEADHLSRAVSQWCYATAGSRDAAGIHKDTRRPETREIGIHVAVEKQVRRRFVGVSSPK